MLTAAPLPYTTLSLDERINELLAIIRSSGYGASLTKLINDAPRMQHAACVATLRHMIDAGLITVVTSAQGVLRGDRVIYRDAQEQVGT
jgi:hypothetical protein